MISVECKQFIDSSCSYIISKNPFVDETHPKVYGSNRQHILDNKIANGTFVLLFLDNFDVI